MKEKILSVVLTAIVFSLFTWFVYLKGQSSIQTEWDREKKQQATTIALVQDKYDKLYKTHVIFSKQVATTLKDKDAQFKKDIDAINSAHVDSMRKSEARAAAYERQAKAGTTEARSLASHAAELDRSIVEGKQVAAELAATVRLRDEQLILLGSQIKADRAILESN